MELSWEAYRPRLTEEVSRATNEQLHTGKLRFFRQRLISLALPGELIQALSR